MDESYLADRGQNLFQTSTHTAHHWRPGYYFPSSNFKVCFIYNIKLTERFFLFLHFIQSTACAFGTHT